MTHSKSSAQFRTEMPSCLTLGFMKQLIYTQDVCNLILAGLLNEALRAMESNGKGSSIILMLLDFRAVLKLHKYQLLSSLLMRAAHAKY